MNFRTNFRVAKNQKVRKVVRENRKPQLFPAKRPTFRRNAQRRGWVYILIEGTGGVGKTTRDFRARKPIEENGNCKIFWDFLQAPSHLHTELQVTY
jgi:hypothetical protein